MAKPYKKQPDDRVQNDLTTAAMGAQIRASLMEKNRALLALSGDSDALVPVVGAAPVDEAYVTIGNTSGLSAERALTGTANQITVTDNGANSTVVLSSPLAANAYVTIGNTANLSAERALTGTANQITVTDNGANSSVVLSTPQNLDTAAAFRVGTLAIGGTLTAGKLLDVYGNVRMRDPSNTAKIVDWDLHLLSAGTVLVQLPNSASGTTRTMVFIEDGVAFSTASTIVSATWQFYSSPNFNPNSDNNWPLFFTDTTSAIDFKWAGISDNNLGGSLSLLFASADTRDQTFQDASGAVVLVGNDADPPASGHIGKVDRTGQTAVVAATTLVDGVVGYFTVHYTLECTQSAVGAGTIQFQVDYTDDVGATTQTSAALILTATGRTRGTLEVANPTGANVTYQTNLTGIFSTSQYALRVRCENLG